MVNLASWKKSGSLWNNYTAIPERARFCFPLPLAFLNLATNGPEKMELKLSTRIKTRRALSWIRFCPLDLQRLHFEVV